MPRLVELNAPLTVEHATYYEGTGLGGLAAQVEPWGLLQADAVLTVSGPLRDHVVALGVELDRATQRACLGEFLTGRVAVRRMPRTPS